MESLDKTAGKREFQEEGKCCTKTVTWRGAWDNIDSESSPCVSSIVLEIRVEYSTGSRRCRALQVIVRNVSFSQVY